MYGTTSFLDSRFTLLEVGYHAPAHVFGLGLIVLSFRRLAIKGPCFWDVTKDWLAMLTTTLKLF